ncbi:hypothetical protein [Deinococcus sp. AJ005]|uniref:hypothetical protein n=1 Tax=Deinococcus sp. AJ005 TaxID=2652443 RepID=UPI00186583C8|nr:hypothetical protein [Deinococcus sp. AJ005]
MSLPRSARTTGRPETDDGRGPPAVTSGTAGRDAARPLGRSLFFGVPLSAE